MIADDLCVTLRDVFELLIHNEIFFQSMYAMRLQSSNSLPDKATKLLIVRLLHWLPMRRASEA
jgi:hypothetical protein